MSFTPNPIFATDYYKECHYRMYDDRIKTIVSYFVPRESRNGMNHVVNFGLQYFIKDFLIDNFNQNFFSKPLHNIKYEYERFIGNTLSFTQNNFSRWEQLHRLGYLPICIRALPEGTLIPIGCPSIMIYNTHSDFAWVTNYIESSLSSYMWHPMASATTAYYFKHTVLEKYYNETVDNFDLSRSLADFSFRGQESLEAACMSSAGFLTSFKNSATVPAGEFLERYYNGNVENKDLISGLASTEHSVMCSSFALDGDEITGLLRLINLYKDDGLNIVCDSYDFDNLVDNILSTDIVKNAITKHYNNSKKFIGIRGDSGNPIKVICGDPESQNKNSVEYKGLVEKLDEIFGSTINSKGYKELYPGIKAVYGDSITPYNAEEICRILKEKGYASNCVAFGMGSYTLQTAGTNDMKKREVLTRDTYGIAIKTTYVEANINGETKKIPVFKSPKKASFKKSPKGLVFVYRDENDNICWKDGFDSFLIYQNSDQKKYNRNILLDKFYNGKCLNEDSIYEIRDRLDSQAKKGIVL